MTFKYSFLSLASAMLLATAGAPSLAATHTAGATTSGASSNDAAATAAMRRDRMAMMTNEKAQLKQLLRAGQPRSEYARMLTSNGFRISAVNEDKPDYLEYEVVKGQQSYEVQIDFDKSAANATKVEVESNLWRADSTKRMMRDSRYTPTGALTPDPTGRYSDRRYLKTWTSEKEQLQKALPLNQKVAVYRQKIEQQGYKVTAVNDREKDYVEYEIAKGDNSYEVQMDVDASTGLVKKIDVTSNLWEDAATDRATSNPRK